MEIETALGRYLHSIGVVNLDETGTAGNTFLGTMPTSPNLAVMLKATGGMALTNELGYDEPTVQVLTRGEPHDRTTPRQLIQNIYAALAGLRDVTFDPGGTRETYVVRVLALQSAPADIGRDVNERHEFSQNFSVHVRNKTNHRQ